MLESLIIIMEHNNYERFVLLLAAKIRILSKNLLHFKTIFTRKRQTNEKKFHKKGHKTA